MSVPGDAKWKMPHVRPCQHRTALSRRAGAHEQVVRWRRSLLEPTDHQLLESVLAPASRGRKGLDPGRFLYARSGSVYFCRAAITRTLFKALSFHYGFLHRQRATTFSGVRQWAFTNLTRPSLIPRIWR